MSIPSVMTLSGFVATSVTNGQDARLPLGILAIAALGIGVGWINALIVNRLRIPPIIATLAVGYILITATLIYNRGLYHICSQSSAGIRCEWPHRRGSDYSSVGDCLNRGSIMVYARHGLRAPTFRRRAKFARGLFRGNKSRADHAHSLHIEWPPRSFWRSAAFRTSERGVPRNGHSVSAPIGWCRRRRGIFNRRRNGNALQAPFSVQSFLR